MNFLPGDNVKYVGSKLRQDLGTKRGTVINEVSNHRSAVVVDFGDDAYICRADSLVKFTPSLKNEEREVERHVEVEVTHKRSKSEDEE